MEQTTAEQHELRKRALLSSLGSVRLENLSPSLELVDDLEQLDWNGYVGRFETDSDSGLLKLVVQQRNVWTS